MEDRHVDGHLIMMPSRTIEVILDADSVRMLTAMEADGGAFQPDGVKRRFLEVLKPQLVVELRENPGVKFLRYSASVVAGVLRLVGLPFGVR